MKKILILFSVLIFAIGCNNTPEEDFFQKKYESNNVKILSVLETDSAYSPHVQIDKIYKTTHKGLTEENYDSIFNKFLEIRREFMKPTYNNCIKKTYAIKIGDNEPYIHTIFYVSHIGNTCIHDKEMIIRQLSDIENNLLHFKLISKNKNKLNFEYDSCLTHNN